MLCIIIFRKYFIIFNNIFLVMKTIILLNPPRSGSSMVSGILTRLGVYIGSKKDMLKGKHVNKYGCYEDNDFKKLDEKILIKAGGVILIGLN